MTRALPIVSLIVEDVPRLFFADQRLQEYRAVDNPHEVVAECEVDDCMEDIILDFGVVLGMDYVEVNHG